MASQTVIRYELKHDDALPPVRQHEGDAGWDICCIEDVYLAPWENKKVSTGLQVEIPTGYYSQIAPRSGLSLKCKLQVMAGVIDRSYQGVINVVLYNASHVPLYFKKHTRIAQMLFVKIAEPVAMVPAHLTASGTMRGTKAFGCGTGLL